MSEINTDSAVMAALRRQMTIAAARQAIAASNLANVNTPGYRAREADFADTLDTKLQPAALRVTNPRHLPGTEAPTVDSREVEGLAARADGNTVQIDRELLSMTQAAGEFARAQTALAAKFRLVRYAISEGR
ncbi:MAG TPA: flagellar basal body rod protein FlgB [Vicinamibacterales bacterium]